MAHPYRPRRAKPDQNQAQMVDELRCLGFCCIITHTLGGDALDFFCGGWSENLKAHVWLQVEVKAGPGGRLTKSEADHLARWPELPIVVAYTTEEVLEWFGRLA
jgi:hypothetical protein